MRSAAERSDRGHGALLLATVILIAANLRPTVQGVGPLIDQIRADTGMSATLLGLLGSLPLLMYALVSPLANGLSRRFGTNRTMLVSLVVIAIATVIRSLPGPDGWSTTALWIGTALTGASIAIANVLSPAVVKRWFPERVHAIMPVYSALLAGTGALASGLVVPLSHLPLGGGEWGWRLALLATGVLAPIGIAFWIIAMRASGPDRPQRAAADAPRGSARIWGDRVAWLVALYMGFQAAGFYMLVTWLSPMSISFGTDESVAGFQVMVMQLVAIAGSLSQPFLLRGWGRRWVPALLPIPAIAGLLGLLIAPSWAFLWGGVFGYASGGMFAVSLWLMADRAREHRGATALSGMAQSAGYVIGGLGPIVFAALHTASGGWVWSLLLDIALICGLLVVGFLLRQHRYVLEGVVAPSAAAGPDPAP